MVGVSAVVVVMACSAAPGRGVSPSPQASVAQPSPSAVPASPPAPSSSIQPLTSAPVVLPSAVVLCLPSSPNAVRAALVTTDPDLHADLPMGWFPMSIASYRREVETEVAQTTDASLKRMIEFELETIDAGILRGLGSGQSGPSCFPAVIGLAVYPTAATLEEAVATRLADQEAHGLPQTVVSSAAVTLKAGSAVRVLLTNDLTDVIPGSVPTQGIEFIVLLPDRRVAILRGAAPTSDVDFGAMVDEVARSLSLE